MAYPNNGELEPHAATAPKPRVLRGERLFGQEGYATGGSTLDGIRACLDARYTFQQEAAAVERELQELARERDRLAEHDDHDEDAPVEDALIVDDLVFPLELRSTRDLDTFVERLKQLRALFGRYRRIVLGSGAN